MCGIGDRSMEEFRFECLSDEEKIILLSAYEYKVDESGDIIDSIDGEKVLSKLTRKPLNLKNAALLPGSLEITDSDPVTLSRYLREKIEDGA